jgi:outer membrane receptor protein involved in Fe transport
MPSYRPILLALFIARWALAAIPVGKPPKAGDAQVWLVDFTVTAGVDRHFDLQAGIRNVLDRRDEDPVVLTLDRLTGDGRSIFLKLVWRAWE